jgi:hypothetical protein
MLLKSSMKSLLIYPSTYDSRETTQSKAGIDKYMLSGCELIDIEYISLPCQNMKLAGE